MSKWNYEHELVGRRVACYVDHDEAIEADVVAVHKSRDLILIRDPDDGELLAGNQWEELD